MANAIFEPTRVRVRVPATVTLGLAVGPVGDDGSRRLTSVVQAVSLFDDVEASWSDPGDCQIDVNDDEAPYFSRDVEALPAKAVEALVARHGGADADELGVSLHITKDIPVAAGVAGGAAAAAASMMACAALWDIDVNTEQLQDLGAGINPDIPFALVGGNAVRTAGGGRLMSGLSRGRYHWVLSFIPPDLDTTPWPQRVFDRFAELNPDPPEPTLDEGILTALAAHDVAALAPLLRNDLTDAVISLRPDVDRSLTRASRAGVLAAVVCGTGPTVALLCESDDHSREVAATLHQPGLDSAVLRVWGPVPGARLANN